LNLKPVFSCSHKPSAAVLLTLLLLVLLPVWAVAQTQERIGLVLSGGGARGLAHVGVLKVLERERIPVDVIAGTSMGAIVGGLYAAGLTASQLERELTQISWAEMFANRVDRPHISHRRKEEDQAFSAAVEFGLREGELRAPQGTVSGRGLEVLLRRLTLPVRQVQSFAQLPTAFGAVATDMESGEAMVLKSGDLAQAMRASMSVPGVFAPIEWNEQLLGDGGLVNNLPVDVARSMGAQRLIAVNVGTPLAPRQTLSTLLGLTTQMVNILTEQNVKRSLAALWQEDVLIQPVLDAFSSADFEQAAHIVRAGEVAAEALLPRLRALALSPQQYAAWQAKRLPNTRLAPRLAAVQFAGSNQTRAERYRAVLASRVGDVFDAHKAVRDARLLAASGDYARVDFRLDTAPDGETLVFDLEDKPWGPNYFRVGLDLSTDVAGTSHFNLRLSHNRHWLNRLGAEWRNQLTLGRTPRLFSEFYQPLSLQTGTASDWFTALWGEALGRPQSLFNAAGTEVAQLQRRSLTSGLDVGQPWGRRGELRLGLWQQTWQWREELASVPLAPDLLQRTQRIGGLHARAVVDLLDDANFPRHGYRLVASALGGAERGGGRVRRLELETSHASSWEADTLNLHLRAAASRQVAEQLGGAYTLGGYQQLSGLRNDQLSGNAMLLLRASYYRRLTDHPVFTRGWFVGASLEAGNTWQEANALSLSGLRWAGSVFIGADTGLGPMYLALGSALQGNTSLYLFIGRP
jgi:NTE family protein